MQGRFALGLLVAALLAVRLVAVCDMATAAEVKAQTACHETGHDIPRLDHPCVTAASIAPAEIGTDHQLVTYALVALPMPVERLMGTIPPPETPPPRAA